MRSSFRERLAFLFSVVVIATLYGYSARVFGWFPHSVLVDAVKQGGRLLSPPEYLEPRVYARSGARSLEPERVQPGLTLVTSAWMGSGGWTQGLMLIDRHGHVVHQWPVDPARLFSDARGLLSDPAGRVLHGAHLFRNGDVLVNIEYVGTVRLNSCGHVRWRLPAGSHHAIERAEDGTFLIPVVSSWPQEGSPGGVKRFPGVGERTHRDQVLRLTGGGTVLDTVSVLEALYASGLERYIAKEGRRSPEEALKNGIGITHLNDAEPLASSMAEQYPLFESGDLLLSLRNMDLVFVLDAESKRVKWHVTQPLIHQHDPDWIGEGWIGIFDNNTDGTDRGTMLGGSRIIAFQPHTKSVKVLFPTKRSDRFYTDIRGKWQQLENGNLLLTESQAGRIVEVAPDGGTVWEWVAEPYSESHVPYVTQGTRTDLNADAVASWECSPSQVAEPPGDPAPDE